MSIGAKIMLVTGVLIPLSMAAVFIAARLFLPAILFGALAIITFIVVVTAFKEREK